MPEDIWAEAAGLFVSGKGAVMRKQKVAICDEDQGYVEAFARRAGRQETAGLEVRAFTSTDALLKFLENGKADLILMEKDLVTKEIAEICSGRIVLLTEQRKQADNTKKQKEENAAALKTIYKYQPCSELLRQILDILAGQQNSFQKRRSGPELSDQEGDTEHTGILQKPSTKCLGIYSPAGRCGKTSLALAMALHLQKKGPTLFISFEFFSGWQGFLPMIRPSGGSLADGIYYLRNGNLKVAEKLLAVEQKIGELAVLPPFPDPQDLLHVTDEEWALVLNSLRYETGYEYIVADLGIVPDLCPAILLNFSEIFVPLPEGETEQAKWDDFQEYLQKNLLDQELEERMKVVRVGSGNAKKREGSAVDQLFYGESGALAEQILREAGL